MNENVVPSEFPTLHPYILFESNESTQRCCCFPLAVGGETGDGGREREGGGELTSREFGCLMLKSAPLREN